MTPWQLGVLARYRDQPVWSVVLPVVPGSSQRTTVATGITYEDVHATTVQARSVRPWIRLGDRVIEAHCNGEFHSFP